MRLPRLLRTTSFRLTALVALIFGASTVIVGAFVYINAKSALDRQERGRIEADAYALKGEFLSGGMSDLMDAIHERQHNRLAGGLDYSLFSDDGKRIYGNLPKPKLQAGWRHMRGPPDGDEPPGQLEQLLVFQTKLSPKLWLVVGDDVGVLRRLDSTFLETFAVGLILAMTLAVGGGVVVSSSFLRRIDAIARTAEAIIEGDIDQRIALSGSGDDLDRLAATLNRMLARISSLMDALRNVSTDIAHDLRTPLGHLRQLLEEAHMRPSSREEYADIVGKAISKTDSILQTFSAILRITQIEAGSRRAGFRHFNFSEMLADLAQSFLPTAEEQNHRVVEKIASNIIVDGDKELITQLTVNLLDNAIRHTPEGTTIEMKLDQSDAAVVLEVNDNGPGVPSEERNHIMDRFYRCEGSRSTPGNGLGLSLVDAIAGLHRASVEALDNEPGLKIRIRFPRSLKPV